MNEHGIALRVCSNTQMLARAERNKIYIKASENHNWVSIVKTVNADDQSIQSLVIFKDKYPQSSWFIAGEVPDWVYTISENGWTSNRIELNWLKEIFLPETASKNRGHKMLVMNSHDSHIVIEFL